ncbi:MAG: NADH-quinone oxidoreductase subunit NuoG [Deltaproteobacteria bacterium]|nr:NADH-quinone oxidoreductase subunit NuoG [Deltaproteobacteria bacterium]
MSKIYIDNKEHEIKDGQNLLQACLSLGFNLPYFCWHPAMHSVGACRQCAVKIFKNEQDTKGRLAMACMTPASDGTRLSIDDPEAKAFRSNVIEWLMTNHPHDCPVCDEGGECHLQDMTVMTGHVARRFRFNKRTYNNQYLGPLINHEMNRCIQCYRCVRFYRDYAGGRDLNVFACHNHVYFGRHADGILENEFSGNLAEVCPTGVFTDKTLRRHYTRKWDLQTAPSICVHCSVGCNTIPGERYKELRRIRNRYNGEVNRYFLCDRGRFGYEFVNSDKRIREPIINGNPSTKQEALKHISSILSSGSKIIGIGSPRASLEANFLLRTLTGPENFYIGSSDADYLMTSEIIRILRNSPAPSPSLRQIELSDAVLILGEDVTNTAPMMALALRQAARQRPMEVAKRLRIPEWDDTAIRTATQGINSPFYVAAPYSTKLDDIAAALYHAPPDDIARLGFAVTHMLDSSVPMPEGLSDEARSLASGIAKDLVSANNPLIVSGTGCGSIAVIQAAANIAWALCKKGKVASLSYAVPECNSIGLGLMGVKGLTDAFRDSEENTSALIIILENDLYQRTDAHTADNFLNSFKHTIVIDHLLTRTASKAQTILPAAAFAESGGTLVNNEGRAQRFYQVFVPDGMIQESWRWLKEIINIKGLPYASSWENIDDVISAISESLPVFKRIKDIAPAEDFRISGMKIARQPHRYSGRTAISANKTIFEPKPPHDPDSPFTFSMEGFQGQPPSPLIPRSWAPGWNSPQAVNKFQSEIGGPLKGGNPGKRLIEPQQGNQVSYFSSVPSAFVPRIDEWLVVPVYHIFGSEELSVLSPGIAELSPKPYLGLNLENEKLNIKEGDEILLTINFTEYRLSVRHIAGLPKGIAALPALHGINKTTLPNWGRVLKLKN